MLGTVESMVLEYFASNGCPGLLSTDLSGYNITAYGNGRDGLSCGLSIFKPENWDLRRVISTW